MTQTEVRHLLSGDLRQMSTMDRALRAAGFDVGRQDVYPTIAERDYTRALRYLFESRVNGWWNQERDLVARDIVTRRQFDLALGRVPRDGRLIVRTGEPGSNGHRARVLTYDQMRVLVDSRKKAQLSSYSDDTTWYSLTSDATWADVNYVCGLKPRHTEGTWYVDHESDEMAIWSDLGDAGENRMHLATTAAHDVEYTDDEMAERVATSYLMVRAERLLNTLMVISLDPKIRGWLAENDRMALKQVEDEINAVFDGQAGPI